LICGNGSGKILGIPRFKPNINITLFNIPNRDLTNPIEPGKTEKLEPINIEITQITTNIYEILFSSLFRLKYVSSKIWYYYMPTGLYNNYDSFITKITAENGCGLNISGLLYEDVKNGFIEYIQVKQREQGEKIPEKYGIHSARDNPENPVVKEGTMLADALTEINTNNESYSKIINFIMFLLDIYTMIVYIFIDMTISLILETILDMEAKSIMKF